MERLLGARDFAYIYISFPLDLDSWTSMPFPRRRVAFVLVLGRLVCLEALREDPGRFLSGRILGNLQQTVTQP